MALEGLVASIIQFLTSQLDDGDITPDSRESLEVAIQCLESAYGVQGKDAPANFNLLNLYKGTVANDPVSIPEASEEAKAEAERYKNEGNLLIKGEKYQEAINNYTKAMQLDGRNAVFYCNRAAAFSKIGNHQQAIKDCQAALKIDPAYSKAYGRLGFAYASLNQHKEAKESYLKAVELEPDNESYKSNLQLAEETFAQHGAGNAGNPNQPNFESAFNNPALLNLARQFYFSPGVQNVVDNLIRGHAGSQGQWGEIIETGRQLVEHLQTTNPDLVETVRREVHGSVTDPEQSKKN